MATLNRTRRWLACAALVAVGMLSAGCALRAAEHLVQDDETEIRQVVDDFRAAMLDGDGKKACSKLAGQLQRDLIYAAVGDDPYPPACPEFLRWSIDFLGADEKAQAERNFAALSRHGLTIRGNRAVFRDPEGRRLIGLRKTPDTGWLIATMWPAWLNYTQPDQNH